MLDFFLEYCDCLGYWGHAHALTRTRMRTHAHACARTQTHTYTNTDKHTHAHPHNRILRIFSIIIYSEKLDFFNFFF